MNPYDILGVDKHATIPQIKSAYRRKAKAMHPDAGGDPDAFIELSNAYTVLMDPEMREHFDLTGEVQTAEVDNFTKQFMEAISHMVGDILKSPDFDIEQFDLVGAMTESFKRARDILVKQQKEQDHAIRQLERLRKRVKRDDENDNLIVTVLDGEISDRAKERGKIRNQIAIADRAIEEMEHYHSPADFLSTVSAMWRPAGRRSTLDGVINIVT